MLKKICGICKQEKNITEYYYDTRNKAYHYSCKSCVKKIATEHYKRTGYFKTKQGKNAWNRASKKAYKKHFKKWMCRAKTRYYVKIGKLIKPVMCELYSPHPKVPCYGKIEAHHSDYSKPLLVKWLCSKHHRLFEVPKLSSK